ncbi:MAG: ANTAR domain-containing response regulator [Pseudomonadota bacterium]
MKLRIPNFRGQRALVLHPHDRNCKAIVEQLERLGVSVEVRWPAEAVTTDGTDMLFLDSDLGFDGLFSWKAGHAAVPIIAVLGSEAPGRIEWTLSQEPSACLLKPIGSTGVFAALSIAFHNFALKHAREETLHRLEERLQMRALVLRAAVVLMKRHDINDEEALHLLRAESMRRRLSLEAMSALVVEGRWIPAQLRACKQRSGQGRKRANSFQ